MTIGVAEPAAASGEPARSAGVASTVALAGAVGLITTSIGFEAGGYFPGTTSIVAIGFAVALILRVGLTGHPFEGFSRRSGLAVAALALFAIWTLISARWSDAPGRAVLETDRVLLYLGALVFFGSLVRRRARLMAFAGGVALGSIVISTAGLLTRVLPAVFPIAPDAFSARLSYPLTYWNAAGLLAAVGILVCLGLSAAERLPRLLRAAIAGAIPVLATTLLLTFSRGAIAAGLIGLVVLCAVCPTRTLLVTLAATAPPTALACHAAYGATALASTDPSTPTAVSQGHHVAIVVALSSVAAVVLRALLSRWDRQPGEARFGRRLGPARAAAIAAALLLAGGAATVALGLPHRVSTQYHRFVTGDVPPAGQQLRQRLLDPGNHGRRAVYAVAADTWRSEPVHGTGAGTFQVQWSRHRPDAVYNVVNAHSVYLGTLSDLGLVGLALLVVCLLAVLGATAVRASARRSRRSERAVAAGLLAALVCWILHAGLDWDWEMPAVTWWVFALGGLALARGSRSRPALAPPRRLTRLIVMLGIAVVALLPAQVGLSQLHLARAISAFKQGNCNAAVKNALTAESNMPARAEPFEIVGYCDARYGHRELALTSIRSAINRDPQNWEYHYDMALVQGAGGLDPRHESRIARALNPLSPVTTALADALAQRDPRVWRAQALAAPLLVPGQSVLRLALPPA